MNLQAVKPLLSAFFLASLFLVSCESEPLAPSCTDGIQNGTETGIDCGGDCPPCATTVEEDKENIQKTFDDMLLCIRNIKESKGVDVLFRDFLKMSDGEVFNEDWVEDMSSTLNEVFDFERIEENNRIDFAFHSGIYTFNHVTNLWDKASASDRIEFHFPSEPLETTNDSEIIIDAYTDQEVVIDNETWYLPVQMHGLVRVDNERIVEVDWNNVVYDDNADFEIPVAWDVSVFLTPVTINTSLNRISSTEFDFDASFLDGDKCSVAVEVDFELLDDDIENLSNSSFKKVEAKVIVGDITVESLAGIAELLAIDNPTDNQINSLLDLRVLFNEVKIADLEIDTELEALVLYYKDSSSENAESYWRPFMEDLEDLWDEFFDFN